MCVRESGKLVDIPGEEAEEGRFEDHCSGRRGLETIGALETYQVQCAVDGQCCDDIAGAESARCYTTVTTSSSVSQQEQQQPELDHYYHPGVYFPTGGDIHTASTNTSWVEMASNVGRGVPFGNSNLMLVRNESSTDMSIVAMLASCSPIALQVQRGSGSLEDAIANCGQKRASGHYPMFEASTGEDPGEEDLGDECTQQVEKKRRLTFDQVRSLEKNFEIENKLEPERKMQLAKELGLQPRQVAVWFQNRRARWKIKQLERDYEVLSSDFNLLKSDYDAVLQEKGELEGKRLYLTKKMQTSSAQPPEQAVDLPEELPGLSSQQFGEPLPQETCDGDHQIMKTERRFECDGDDQDIGVAKGIKGRKLETSSGSMNSSELLDADSPDSGVLLPLDNIGAYPQSIDESSPLGKTGESNIIHMSECLLGDQLLSLHGCHRISVKLEDGSFQDDSCNYMLSYLDEERSLPWWDWP